MLGSAKALKRNNRECKGILNGPLMAPRFSDYRDSAIVYFTDCQVEQSAWGSNFAARMASRRNFAKMLDPKLVVRLGASFWRAFFDFVGTSQDLDVHEPLLR